MCSGAARHSCWRSLPRGDDEATCVKIAILGLRAIGPGAAGGVEKAIEELSTRYVLLGHDVTVFCRARYARDVGSEFNGVKLRKLPAIYTKHLEAISNTVAAIACSLRGYDIVHVNATGPALLSFLPRLFGRRVVVTVHGLDWKREKWGYFARWALKAGAWASVAFPHRTIVVSKTLREHYASVYRRTVDYIPNGVTLPDQRSPHEPTSTGLAQDGYVLFLSRLVPEKGCHTLIEAFRGLQTDKKLVIVGPPSHSQEYATSLHRLAEGDDRIVFAGPLFGEEKDAIYRGAYLFVLPSSIEGMALVLLEAMSHGKGCLCSDIDENREVIDPGFDPGRQSLSVRASTASHPGVSPSAVAATFTTGNVEDLRGQLARLIADKDEVQRLGALARTHVSTEFNWDAIARRHLEVFADWHDRR